MAGSQGEIAFEVRVLQGDTWQIHARYSKVKQRTAIEDAKSLEKISTIKAVKVVRESYNQATGLSSELDVYKSPNLIADEEREAAERRAKQPSRGPAPSDSMQRRSRIAAKSKKPAKTKKPKAAQIKASPPRPDEESPRKKRLVFAGVIKLLLVVMVSIVLATLVMELASFILSENRPLGARLSAGTRANVLVGVFVSAFLLSAFSMVSAFIKKGELDISLQRRQPAARKPPPAERPKPAAPVEDGTPAADEAPPPPEVPAPAASPVVAPLSAYGETQKVFMMKFLGESLERVKASRSTMDNYNLFGVNMYLAGACEAMSQKRKLDVRTSSVILGDAVQAMGYKKVQAQSFAGKYVEYLVADSRYMQMYQAGRNAMNTTLTDDSSGAEDLEKALVEWNKPKVKEEKAGPVTVMFTDMVGSTNLTQTMGDEVAQQVVRAHNRIVREALNVYAGKEIKHTGDGIMASFAITSTGVEAAIFIQRGVVRHNEANPDLGLHLKVGINAGEPIVEDDDLFGTTVQVAARTVDKAKSGQIFVTEIVHGICAGKGLKFINRGQFEMKGVTEPITLFEAVWDESILAEAAAQEAVPPPAEDGEAKEDAGDAAQPVEDEAAVDEADAESDAGEKDGAPAAEAAAAGDVEEVAETGESAEAGEIEETEEIAETGEATETAPPQETVEPVEPEERGETEEKPLPEGAQRPPAAGEDKA